MKRGLSEVVTNVIIILLVLAAIAIIWAFVRPTIQESGKQIEFSQFSTRLSIVKPSIAIDNSTTNLTFSVMRQTGQGSLKGVTVLVTDSTGLSKSFTYNFPSFEELESKKISINYTNTSAPYLVNVAKIEIVPVLDDGSASGRLGQSSDVYTVIGTPSGSSGGSGGGAVCGNSIVEGSEQCDGANLNGATCNSVVPGTVGTLSCSGTCTFVTSGCAPASTCGNGIVEGTETCDAGASNGLPGYCNSACTGTQVPIVPTGYTGYWRFNSNNANDVRGVHNGALVGGATVVGGASGYLNIPTSSGDGVTVLPLASPNDLNMSNRSSVTASAWVKYLSSNTNNVFDVMGQKDNAGNGWELIIQRTATGNPWTVTCKYVFYDTTFPAQFPFQASVSTGSGTYFDTPKMVTCMFDRQTLQGSVYLNGALVSGANNPAVFGLVNPGKSFLSVSPIGFNVSAVPSAQAFGPGQIDEVVLYNRTLSAGEIANIYTAQQSVMNIP